MKEKLIGGIKKAFSELSKNDGYLFSLQIEKNYGYDSRKLHEVCINHKLANYLEQSVLPILPKKNVYFFADIEFNREGVDGKKMRTKNGKEELVRPDIIIHNRKSGVEKNNFLVIECKKEGASYKAIEDDQEKIKWFMNSPKYEYQYGLQVIYMKDKVKGKLFYKQKSQILEEGI